LLFKLRFLQNLTVDETESWKTSLEVEVAANCSLTCMALPKLYSCGQKCGFISKFMNHHKILSYKSAGIITGI
jgi:hypothetical protein